MAKEKIGPAQIWHTASADKTDLLRVEVEEGIAVDTQQSLLSTRCKPWFVFVSIKTVFSEPLLCLPVSIMWRFSWYIAE